MTGTVLYALLAFAVVAGAGALVARQQYEQQLTQTSIANATAIIEHGPAAVNAVPPPAPSFVWPAVAGAVAALFVLLVGLGLEIGKLRRA
jgi:hypothetical protein